MAKKNLGDNRIQMKFNKLLSSDREDQESSPKNKVKRVKVKTQKNDQAGKSFTHLYD